jgi:hypothetical protein
MTAPALGSITFDEVRGVITPRTVPVIEGIDNPGLTPAVVLLLGADRVDRLTFRGFFTTSQKAGLFAIVAAGTAVNCTDETGAVVSCLVRAVMPTEHVARCGNVAGKWVECAAEVTAWA